MSNIFSTTFNQRKKWNGNLYGPLDVNFMQEFARQTPSPLSLQQTSRHVAYRQSVVWNFMDWLFLPDIHVVISNLCLCSTLWRKPLKMQCDEATIVLLSENSTVQLTVYLFVNCHSLQINKLNTIHSGTEIRLIY